MFESTPHDVALWFSRTSHFFGSLPAICFLRFVVNFLEEKPRRIHPIHYVLAIGSAIATLTPWFIVDVPRKLFFPYYPEPGPLYPLLLSTYFVTFVTSFVLLYGAYRDKSLGTLKRMQSLWILVGLFLAWCSVATLFLPIYDIDIVPQMGFYPLIAVATIYAILRYQFLDIRVVVTRAGLLLAVYLIVLGVPFVVGWRGQNWLEGSWGSRWWLIPLGLLAVLATVGPFTYAYLRRQAEERLLREQRQYQRTLQYAARGMTRVRDLRKLVLLITRVVSRAVGVTHASLFLWDKAHERYVLRASHGPKRLALQSRYTVDASHPLIQWLRKYRRAVTDEDLTYRPDPAIQRELAGLGAVLVMPGFVENHLVGFLALGPKLSGAGYSADDLHAFTTLAHEAAMAIENAVSYDELLKVNEQLKAASERLLVQERLAAAGQFATGMAHEIKNPLSAIKTFAQYLPEKYEDPEFRKKFFRIVQSEIDRINGIVQELSDFAKPAPLQLQPVRLAELVTDTLAFLSDQCLKQSVQVETSLAINGLAIQADPRQLKQVLLNLLLNSLEATAAGGKINVRLAIQPPYVTLAIADTGCGISPECQGRVFDPFFTTKERGMGLGLAIVQGIVERHGGRISLSSTPGRGTIVEVRLPLLSDLAAGDVIAPL
jgi:signal transduction histidine kinase